MSTPFDTAAPTNVSTFTGRAVGEPMNIRDQFLAQVAANGWVLDTTARVHGRRTRDGEQQDPFAFTRPAEHGGTWHLRLDYSTGDWIKRYDNTLRGVTLWHIPEGGLADGERPHKWGMRNIDLNGYQGPRHLWDALADPTGRKRILRRRAELLIRNPDLAVWEAAKTHWEERELDRARQERSKQLREARLAGPPVTCDRAEYALMAQRLLTAARDLKDADATADLRAMVAEAKTALAMMEGVLK